MTDAPPAFTTTGQAGSSAPADKNQSAPMFKL